MKKLVTYLLISAMVVMVGCSEKDEGGKIPSDKFNVSDTTATTGDEETTGKDIESGETTKEKNSQLEVDKIKESDSSTAKGESDTITSDETTKKETTTEQQTTTEKQTTTKKQTTTEKQTTTQKQTTTKSSTTGGGMVSSGTPKLDITVSPSADAKASNIVSLIISSNMNEYDRVKAIHDYIVINVRYDYEGLQAGLPNNSLSYTAEGALVYGRAVCQGYAEAFELLCQKAGVQAQMVYGEATGSDGKVESHAWNIVRIQGNWYQIDCTWDDPIVNNVVVTGRDNLTYTYFLLTDSEMYVDHRVDKSATKNLKNCTDTLFKGYAKELSLDVKLEGKQYVSRVYSLAEVKEVVKNYTKNGNYTFTLVFPQSLVAEEAAWNTFKGTMLEAVKEVVEENKWYCSYGTGGGTTMNIFDYVVFDTGVTIEMVE